MASVKPLKKRINQNSAQAPNSEDGGSSALTAGGSEALLKLQSPFAAEPQLSSDTGRSSAAPRQADEVWKSSLAPTLKLLKKTQELAFREKGVKACR